MDHRSGGAVHAIDVESMAGRLGSGKLGLFGRMEYVNWVILGFRSQDYTLYTIFLGTRFPDSGLHIHDHLYLSYDRNKLLHQLAQLSCSNWWAAETTSFHALLLIFVCYLFICFWP